MTQPPFQPPPPPPPPPPEGAAQPPTQGAPQQPPFQPQPPPFQPQQSQQEGAPQQPESAQRPPSQAPLPSQGAPENTVPFWYGQTQHPAYPPVLPQTPAASWEPGAEPARSANPRRWAGFVTMVLAAVLAAVLASAGTYAVTRGDVAESPSAQARTNANASAAPVVQADASAPNWTVTAAAVSPSVVAISVEGSQGGSKGSGVIFDTKGHILTNNHVVTGQDAKISVTLNDKRAYDATIVGTDPSTDLAVIKLTNGPSDLKAIALGDSNTLKVGDPVMAVGNPLGLAGTVTTGIVSALNRPVVTGQQSAVDPVVTNAVQTSAAINPGNSGGALVNAGGQLVGINSSIPATGSSGSSSSQSLNIGIGFAIPSNEARSIGNQLITTGKADHAYLGVKLKDGVVADGSAKRAAAVTTSVEGGTPAGNAGIQEGDAIIEVDGDPVDSAFSLIGQIRERGAGDKVTLKFLRDGQTKTVSVTLVSKATTGQ